MKATLKDKAFSVSDNHKFVPNMLHVLGCLFKLCVSRLNIMQLGNMDEIKIVRIARIYKVLSKYILGLLHGPVFDIVIK